VYERTPVPLSGFGAGIVVQPELVRYFLERTSITVEHISVPSSAMRYWDAATSEPRGEIAADWRYTSYNALYRGLLDSWGSDRYHLGEALVGLHQTDEAVELRFASGRAVSCELAVCADGSFSTARQRLLGISPRYAGYVTWRGLAGRERLSQETWDFFDHAFNYGLLDDGHLIAYPIPVVDEAELRVADRQVNWQWYWNVPEGPELDELMTDNEGARRPVTVHHDLLQHRHLAELHTRATSRLMAPFAELLTRSERPFVTVIADTSTPRMAVGRCALIGDAAVTGRPHAAAGGAKAAANAWALADALVAAQGVVHEALRRWEPKQLEAGYALLAKVRRMGTILQHGGAFEPGDRANRFGLPAIA
jgi:2,6-dihydroxypyridine 3-monooxygenase